MSDDPQVDGGATRLATAGGATDEALKADRVLSLYREMLVIRELERTIESLHRLGRMSGSFHSSLGQEACAVGVCSALRAADIVTSTHRGHGHAVAKGVPVREILAELLGRRSGVSGGRGGSMHLHHRDSGFYGETAIVAGGLAWAAGAAWARRRKGRDDVAVAFIGDGAFAQGATHEALLLARHWSSPCLVVCENNGLAHSMPSEQLFGPYGAIAERAASFGIDARYVDARDVLSVADTAEAMVCNVRATGMPAFLECGVYRVRPHSLSDADYRYRQKDAGATWLAENDPIARLRRRVEPALVDDLTKVEADVQAVITAALASAESDAPTNASAARHGVYATPDLDRRG